MTAYTAYYRTTTGLNLYAKPFPLTNPWGDDDISLTEGIGGQYSFTADSELEYCIFLRAGASPSATDQDEATIPKNQGIAIDAIAEQINTQTILPVYGTVLSALEARYLTIKTNEAVTLVIGLTDTNGDPVSTIGMTLEAVFESGTTEVVIPNADITKAATGVSLVATSALNSTERLWTYALRRTTDEAVLIRGKLEVSYAPNN